MPLPHMQERPATPCFPARTAVSDPGARTSPPSRAEARASAPGRCGDASAVSRRGASHVRLKSHLLAGLLTALTSAHWALDTSVSRSADRASLGKTAEGLAQAPADSDAQPMAVSAPASCDEVHLSPRDVQLLLELGNSTERAFLREQLRCSSDPALLEAAIAWHLNRDEDDIATHWAQVAETRGLTVLPWQRTLLALRRDDKAAVAGVLRTSAQDLPVSARIEALRYLGENEHALRLAQHEAGQAADPAERQRMEELAQTLNRAETASLGAGVSTLDYGPLSVRTLEASGEVPMASGRLGVSAKISDLDSSARDELDLADLDREQDLSLSLTQTYGVAELSAVAGASLREEDSIAYGSLQFQRPLSGPLLRNLSLKAALNDLSYETAWCRAFCTKSHVTAVISGGLSRWDFFNLSLDAAGFATRDDEALASGFGLDGALGYVIFQDQPRWDLSLRGALQSNDLADEVPSALKEASSGALEISDVLPAEYRFLGVGTSLQGGDIAPSPGEIKYSLDAHAGWQWPAKEPSYGVQMSLATAWPSPQDALSFRLLYASSLAGGSEDSFSQVALRYDRRF